MHIESNSIVFNCFDYTIAISCFYGGGYIIDQQQDRTDMLFGLSKWIGKKGGVIWNIHLWNVLILFSIDYT